MTHKPNTGNASTENKKVEDLFSVSGAWARTSKDHRTSDLNISWFWDKKDDTTIISLVNDIFLNALKMKASDIHIEPRDKDLNIRFRGWWYIYQL